MLNKAGVVVAQMKRHTPTVGLKSSETVIVLPGHVKVTVESTPPPGVEALALDHTKRYRVIIVEESE